MSMQDDLDYCDEHRELADLLLEHGCAPAGEDRELLRALVEWSRTRDRTPAESPSSDGAA
jgi:hypothetical protein